MNKANITTTSNNDNASADNMLMWEYECHQCKSGFKVPVPRGPAEEKNIRCTKCGSMDITRENIGNLEVAFCGG